MKILSEYLHSGHAFDSSLQEEENDAHNENIPQRRYDTLQIIKDTIWKIESKTWIWQLIQFCIRKYS